MASPLLRHETATDALQLYALHCSAFGGATEAKLVNRLREDRDVALSLVAEEHGQVVGHLLLSPLQAPFRALALAPLAVRPDRQKQGIGFQLLTHAHGWAQEQGYDAIFVMGDPDYYGHFGYSVSAACGYACPYAGEYFMIKSFRHHLTPRGTIEYPPAFEAMD